MSGYLDFVSVLNKYSQNRLTKKDVKKLVDLYMKHDESYVQRNNSGYIRYWNFCRWLYFDFYCSIRGVFRIIFGTRVVKDQFGRYFICFGNRFGYKHEIFKNKIKIFG